MHTHRPIITWGSAALFCVTAIVLVFLFLRIQDVSSNTHNALCAYKADLVFRLGQETDFLKQPERFPSFNTPAIIASTKVTVMNQERTLKAFNKLEC